MSNESVAFSIKRILGLDQRVRGTLSSAANGLAIDYTITPAELPLVRRGLKDNVVPWGQVMSMQVDKGFFGTKLVLRTRGWNPLTGDPETVELVHDFGLDKDDWEAAERVCLGLTQYKLDMGEASYDAEMDDLRGFIDDL